jgi:hypothetical protein
LKKNASKTKIVVFKKGGKLSKYENWKLGGEEIEVAYEIKYVGVILDGRGKWEKEKRQVGIRGKTALNSINMCLARAPNMGINKKIVVFWVVAPCSLVEVYQCFRGPCCLHHQGDTGAIVCVTNRI